MAYAKNIEEFVSLIIFLNETELIEIVRNDTKCYHIKLKVKGWDLANERRSVDSKQGFIAIWFNDEMKESKDAIIDAIKENGWQHFCLWGEHFSTILLCLKQ